MGSVLLIGMCAVMQAHESPVRSMQYAHNENWLLTGEDDGKLKYWKPNLECVKVSCFDMLQVSCCMHSEAHHTCKRG